MSHCRQILVVLIFSVFTLLVFGSPFPFAQETFGLNQTKNNSFDVEILNLYLLRVLGEEVSKRQVLAKEAIQISENILQKKPDDLTANLVMISALGTLARSVSRVESVREKYAWKTRDYLEKVSLLAPDEPWVNALFGSWHLEVMRRSSIFGPLFLGASIKDGIHYFEKAVANDSKDPFILFAYTLGLVALDEPEYRPQALELLTTLTSGGGWTEEIQHKFEKVFKNAQTLQQLLLKGDLAMANQMAISIM